MLGAAIKNLLLAACVVWSSGLFAQSVDHSIWNQLLQNHVEVLNNGSVTQVDYDGLLSEHQKLKQYLDSLSQVTQRQFDGLSKQDQLALLINAYNAWTVELILTEYPDVESIRDLGSLFRSPWKKKFIPFMGETISLDNIEHGLIREPGKYNDPRIHFAVNCASIGCPALRAEAYSGDQLNLQLEDATENFLQDRERNRLVGDELQVSSIFKWYREDFEKGWLGFDSLLAFFAEYSDNLGLKEKQKVDLVSGKIDIGFLDYNWQLNKN